ncbi:MAG TPA: hypothetical protein VFI91_06905 [Longimicrobiaceae bacterium]|nr:hypothetical protein [Longimicrobiaceae bacterium]
MSKMIQIRNVPDELHRTLKARAALDGPLAEALGAPILTRDARLKSAPVHHAIVEVI